MLRPGLILTLIVSLLAAPSRAATVWICWQGANGYTMSGRMEFPDTLLDAEMITEADVTAFEITGYRDGIALGSWSLAARQDRQTWYLRYLPREGVFPTDERVPGPFDQGWNADGTATDCGPGGFGFNAGNYAQDFCLDGVWLEDSGMPPSTPFYALDEAPYIADCSDPALLS